MNGVTIVAGLEFRLRLRTGRWRILLFLWFALLLGIAALIRDAASPLLPTEGVADSTGTVMFGGLMLVVLALALLITPRWPPSR